MRRPTLDGWTGRFLSKPSSGASPLIEHLKFGTGWCAERAGDEEMTNLPAALRARLTERVPLSTLAVASETTSQDGTVKTLFHTVDGRPIEAVLMRYRDGRRSVCVSSQSGCPLTCSFCATGQMSYGREPKRR